MCYPTFKMGNVKCRTLHFTVLPDFVSIRIRTLYGRLWYELLLWKCTFYNKLRAELYFTNTNFSTGWVSAAISETNFMVILEILIVKDAWTQWLTSGYLHSFPFQTSYMLQRLLMLVTLSCSTFLTN
jgi:hypothetical protein